MRADSMAAATDIRILFGTEIDWSSPPMRYKFMRDRDELDAADPEFDELGFSTRAIHQPVDLSLNHPAQSVRKISGADNNAHSATDMLEKTLARLEGAEAGLVLSSGLAAFNMLALALLSEGDEMIVHRQVCTDTAALMEKTLTRAGITMVPVDLSLPANICRAVTPRTRLIYFDTPTNPLGDILDIAAIAECGRSCGLKIVVDSTFASPALQRPIEHGADIVLQSLTKYINGHGDTLGGALLGDTAIIHKLRETNLRFPEATVISPQASFLILRGLKTLALRMDRHSSAAHAIALTLETHPAVAWVRYPFLPSHPNHSIARRQMSGGSGMLAFGLRAGRDGATAMISRLRLIQSGVNLAEVGSLICHSARLTSTRHLSLSGGGLCDALGDDVIRCSVGLEDAEDLIEDILEALDFG
ncbi:trans-sulfuration enzyme family protein [Rhizobium leguminosarum]|uniref:trans-sulfuration enzyme family protein n=1 Tax=Rhizobium leguminosarum TaxID=384 RepID=UPI0021BBDE9F|nr:aminotransferase class I/II-fold pyridoxal phosphate-dependent enzyme [Rhizobium leguminosarum]